MKTPDAPLQGPQHLGPSHDLREVRRPDLLLAFRHHHQVHRRLAPRAPDGVKGGQERRLRPFLIHRAPAHHDLPESGLRHQRGVKRRRGPLGRIHLLHVVHEVEPAASSRRARVQRGEDPRLPARSPLWRRSGTPPRGKAAWRASHPSFIPRFSAAIDGWCIHCCSRFTFSSWRLRISA